jgi:hypothetical protein
MTVALLAGVVTLTVVSCVRGTGECPPGQTLVRTKNHRMEQWECRTL